jgi:Holliday junction resolvase RusA-like endonuclease
VSEQTTIPGTREPSPEEKRAQAYERRFAADLILPGKPMTWARVRTRSGQFFTDPKRAGRQGDIAAAYLDADQPRFGKGINLEMKLEFVFDRPASHYGTGRNAGILKPKFIRARPGRGANGGDLDNLVKLVTDALNGIAYADDSQIAISGEAKRYVGAGEFPHTRVQIRAL